MFPSIVPTLPLLCCYISLPLLLAHMKNCCPIIRVVDFHIYIPDIHNSCVHQTVVFYVCFSAAVLRVLQEREGQ